MCSGSCGSWWYAYPADQVSMKKIWGCSALESGQMTANISLPRLSTRRCADMPVVPELFLPFKLPLPLLGRVLHYRRSTELAGLMWLIKSPGSPVRSKLAKLASRLLRSSEAKTLVRSSKARESSSCSGLGVESPENEQHERSCLQCHSRGVHFVFVHRYRTYRPTSSPTQPTTHDNAVPGL